jgi:uncharacterized protein YlxP (DUF503 family)
MREGGAFVCLLRVHLHFPESRSLKAKRAELNRIKALLRDRMGATVAEVAHQDAWQRSTLAVALTAGSEARARDGADAIGRLLDSRFPDGVWVERRVASWQDLDELG